MDDEFDLIARIRARAGTRDDVLLGIGDDAAILRVPSGHDLVVSTDTLNVGVHFPIDTAPADIGWKALAVNLSDLAAMGAEPAWCTLNLTLPQADAAWLDAFLDGFLELAAQHKVALVGGDTTRGPLSITVTAHGFVPHGAALRRDGARDGDEVWVSGTLGDAAAGLALTLRQAVEYQVAAVATVQSPSPTGRGVGVRGESERESARFAPHPGPLPMGEGEQQPARQAIDGDHQRNAFLRARLDRPTPRVALGLALRGIATACIDVSDGLLADLSHVVRASGVGALIDAASLPISPALRSLPHTETLHTQLGGGDDYELCFTAPSDRAEDIIAAANKSDTSVTRIGRIDATTGLRLRCDDGVVREAPLLGFTHFDAMHDGWHSASGAEQPAASRSPNDLLRHPAGWIATGFGSGFSPRAPGTAGTLAALLPWLWLRTLPLPYYLAALVVAFAVGVWASSWVVRRSGIQDPQVVVWDEFVGVWIALTAAPAGWAWMLAGFVLFRVFDIWKPWPVRWADRKVHGGLGVMLDDVIAGLYALVVMQFAARW